MNPGYKHVRSCVRDIISLYLDPTPRKMLKVAWSSVAEIDGFAGTLIPCTVLSGARMHVTMLASLSGGERGRSARQFLILQTAGNQRLC